MVVAKCLYRERAQELKRSSFDFDVSSKIQEVEFLGGFPFNNFTRIEHGF